jgi:peptidoglycan/xylan/chitin deacetylase (PgdA/CDA1 family)
MNKKDHVRVIKIGFTAIVIGFGIFMVAGSFLLYPVTHRTEISAILNFHYLSNKLAFNFGGVQTANAISFFKTEASLATSSVNVAQDVPVLLYHGITSSSDRFTITPQTFQDQMFALKKAGYSTITLDDFRKFMEGEKTLPPKSFLLTFDDGRLDSFLGADPVLRALDFHAVMFIAAHFSLGEKQINDYYLYKPDIKKMEDSGRWEIESHAMQNDGGIIPISSTDTENFLSNKKWLTTENRLETDTEYEIRVKHELTDSKNIIDAYLNKHVIAFSYPFSDSGDQSINNIDQAQEVIAKYVRENYKFAFEQISLDDGRFASNLPGDNMYHLHRIESGTSWSGTFLVNYLRGAESKIFQGVDSFGTSDGWKRTWGTVGFDNDKLVLSATATTTGAFTFLDGTKLWDDYFFSSSLDWQQGSHVSLVARYLDSQNYTACTFSQGNVSIENYENGVPTNLARVDNFVTIATSSPVSLSVLASGNSVKCYVGGTIVAYATIHGNHG